jgi:hypothetical protein
VPGGANGKTFRNEANGLVASSRLYTAYLGEQPETASFYV